MIKTDKLNKKPSYSDQPMDIEIACYFFQLIDSNRGALICGLIDRAREAIKDMSNPFAIKMLMDKIDEEQGGEGHGSVGRNNQ